MRSVPPQSAARFFESLWCIQHPPDRSPRREPPTLRRVASGRARSIAAAAYSTLEVESLNMPNQANGAAGAASDPLQLHEVGVLQETLHLKTNQATTLHELLERTAPAAVEASCFIFQETNVKLLAVRRVRGSQEKCEKGHRISIAYELQCASQWKADGQPDVHVLGSTCAAHVLNLPPILRAAVAGLGRWVRLAADRELPEYLAKRVEALKSDGVPDYMIGDELWVEFRRSADYAEVTAAAARVKGHEADAADSSSKERRRMFNVARLCHALKTVEVCEAGELPFPRSVMKRIRRADQRLAQLGGAKAAAAPAAVPFPSPTVSPASSAAATGTQPAPVTYLAPAPQPAPAAAQAATPSAPPNSGSAGMSSFSGAQGSFEF